MEKLLEILEDIQPNVDYKNCTSLIDDEILDSFAILSIVGEIEDEFGVSVTPAEIVPENFKLPKRNSFFSKLPFISCQSFIFSDSSSLSLFRRSGK